MKPEQLIEHPEGGRFAEVYRSPGMVKTEDGHIRCNMTHIYFELRSGEVSRFHRVVSDEVWNLYRGDGLQLLIWDGISGSLERIQLSAETGHFCHVVPAGSWQAAAPISSTVLVGCTVAPGFEFDDFRLISPDSIEATTLKEISGDLSKFIDP